MSFPRYRAPPVPRARPGQSCTSDGQRAPLHLYTIRHMAASPPFFTIHAVKPHPAKDDMSENDARYCVVQLLYRGKVKEAEQALDNLVKEGALSRQNEAFYRALIKGAHEHLGK